MDKNLLNYFNGDEFCAGVWKSKYAMEGEITPDDMHKRLAKEFARIEAKYQDEEKEISKMLDNLDKISAYGKNRKHLTEKDIYKLFKNFKYIIPQGRVMAGLGVTESYRSLSNCLRLPPPKDSYSSIMYSDTMLVSAAKRGCGYGLGLSNLRPDTAFVSNAANTSTGAPSFMSRYSNSTREVAQKGRRGACLLDMSIFHPDVLQFIRIKKDKIKVTGANISVKLYNEFMEAVENDADFILRFPCDTTLDSNCEEVLIKLPYNELYEVKSNTYIKKIRAKEYWDEIIENAWDNAEPGLFFWDRVLNYDPSSVYSKYYIDGTNACGEQPMAVYDTCRLILLNLYSFVKNPFTSEAEIDYDMLYKVAYEQLRLGDNLVDLEIEYIDRILAKIESDDLPDKEKAIEKTLWINVKDMAESGRRVGCGITALADMVAAAGFKYDSEEGIATIAKVMKTKMRAELHAGIDLAILRGNFTGWTPSKEFSLETFELKGENDFYQMLVDEFPGEAELMYRYGRRNVNWSTIAPAGSTSIIAQTEDFPNMAAGCEPQFMCFYMRSKKVNPGDKDVRVDYIDDNGDAWQEFPVMMGGFKQYMKERIKFDSSIQDLSHLTKEQVENYYKESPYYMATANDIDWLKRVKIQGILQRYTTSAISSTLNLPKDVSKQTVSDIYFAGWKEGVKGITIYRDGCRTGVLNAESNSSRFEPKDAVKRPSELKAHAHKSTSKGTNYHVLIGLMDEKPYEVFIDNSENTYSSEGKIMKEARGTYVFKNGGDPVQIKDFMTPEQQAITRLVSMGLRHGTAIVFVVEQLQKIDGDMFSFAKSLARVLKKYIPDDTPSTETCKDCGSTNVKFQEGCSTCMECGSSKCG